jgi:hypothetical protein
LWRLSLLFLVLSIISLVPTVYNYLEGNYFSNSISSLEVYIAEISIANFYGGDPKKSQT